MSISMSEQLLLHYLVDFENYLIDGQEDPNFISTWINSVTNDELWSKLMELSFEENQLKLYFEDLDIEQTERYFSFGVACIVCFVQKNFTGPDLPKHVEDFFSSSTFAKVDFNKLLSLNNEDINVNAEYPQLLTAAKVIFQTCIFNETLNLWWTWRSIIIHQQILDELSPTLLSTADRLRKDINKLALEGMLTIVYYFARYTDNGMSVSVLIW